MKQSINRIDIIQKWKNKPLKENAAPEDHLLLEINKKISKERIEGNPSPTGRKPSLDSARKGLQKCILS
jgi:hypothetical protein